jgi:branched-chain amino acid aminotransferase
MKAFRGVDGKVRIFRIEDGGRRMQDSCRGIQMPELPLEKFVEAVKKVVELNADFIPPMALVLLSTSALYCSLLLLS